MVRILVVEDDTDINNMTAEFLKGKGCGVEQAFSGTEGRLLWQMKDPSISGIITSSIAISRDSLRIHSGASAAE